MEAPLESPLENAPQKAPPSRCASTSFELSSTRRANSSPATGKSLCITVLLSTFGTSSNLVGLQHRQIGRLLALENPTGEDSNLIAGFVVVALVIRG